MSKANAIELPASPLTSDSIGRWTPLETLAAAVWLVESHVCMDALGEALAAELDEDERATLVDWLTPRIDAD